MNEYETQEKKQHTNQEAFRIVILSFMGVRWFSLTINLNFKSHEIGHHP